VEQVANLQRVVDPLGPLEPSRSSVRAAPSSAPRCWLRTAGRVAPLKHRDGVDRIALYIGKNFEPQPRYGRATRGFENSSPVPARRPALASRSEYDVVNPGYSKMASWVSGVSAICGSCTLCGAALELSSWYGPVVDDPYDHTIAPRREGRGTQHRLS
jgi:hypothetical protein